MLLRPSTARDFLIVAVLVLGLAVVLTHSRNGTVFAQTPTPATTSAAPEKPGTVSKVKAKSKETWANMKARWAKQKERWAGCQMREKAEKRTGHESRAFLEECMTKQ
jgi:hypothetical protein